MKTTLRSILLVLVLALLAVPVMAAETGSAETTHSHCVCGEGLTGVAAQNHSCSEDPVVYEAWGDSPEELTLLPTSGNYYLVANITVAYVRNTGNCTITSGNTLNLCLNGYNVYDTARAIDVKAGATLNLTDCKGTGVINGNSAMKTGTAAVCFVRAGGTVNLYGGTLNAANGTKMTGACGNTYVSSDTTDGSGVLNMYGGAITNGRAQSCGNIYLGGLLNMYGGVISAGSSTTYGGNINVDRGTLNLVAGTVTGGTAETNGGNIRANVALVIGAVEISGGKAANGGNLYTEDSCNVTLNGTVLTGGEASGNGGSINAGGTFYLNQNGSVTGGGAEGNGGNIYARRSVNLNSGTVSGGYAGGSGGNIYGLRYGSKTTANTDGTTTVQTNTSSPTVKVAGAAVSGGTAVGNGGNIYGSCTVTVTAGTVTGGTANKGGNIYIVSSDQVSTTKDAEGNVTGTSTTTVANTLTVSGGTVTMGSAENGGNIQLEKCTLSMTGGTVSNGTAVYNGGNIYSNGTLGTVSISGATITGGIASNDGGKTATYGGNLYLNTKTVTIKNTTISDGQATHGGNIEATSTAKAVTVTDCQITGGIATLNCGASTNTGNGGNIHITNGANVTLTNCTLSGGQAYRGGNISAFGTVTVDACTVSNGYAIVGGGNIFSYNNGNVTVNAASTVMDGTSDMDGGNVLVTYGGEATFNGTALTGGTAVGRGGSIGVEGRDGNGNASVCTLNGAVITGSSAANGSAVSVRSYGICNIIGSSLSADGSIGVGVVYVMADGTLSLTDSEVRNLGDAGVGIRNCGSLALLGKVELTGPEAEGALDIILDAQNDSGAAIDITGLTGQDEPYTVTRWADDDGLLDTGLIAVGAVESQAAMFKTPVTGYDARYAAGCLYLMDAVVQGMAEGQVVSGYPTLDEALAADTQAKYFRIHADLDGQTVNRDIILDLQGNSLTNVTVPVGVTLQLADSSSDRTGTVSGTVEGTIPTLGTLNGKNYLTVAEDGVYSAHGFDVRLTHVSIVPSKEALGYKAKLTGDQTVMDHVTGFGFNLWITGNQKKTWTKTENITNTLTLRLENILKGGGGETSIYGNAFVNLTVDGETYTVTCKDYSTSMKKAVETVNEMLETNRASLTQTQVNSLQALLGKYEAVNGWSSDAIVNWIPASDDLVQELAADSMVLLKNENQSLPLATGTKINLFGYNATDLGFLLTGGGSGSTRTAAAKNVSLLQAFQDAGVAVNMDLYNQYAAWDTLDMDSNSTTDAPQCILSNPGEDFYTDALLEQAREFSDTAVVVISRWGRENGVVKDAGVSHYEIPFIQVKSGMETDTSRTYLQISTEEELMLQKVTENFDNVIVLLNLCNTMELGFLDDAGIDSALFIGMPGQSGTRAIPRLLFGDITPSGKTADIYPYNHKADPTWANALVDRSNSSNKYITYQEGIYYGYRWYETAFADGVQLSANGYAQDFSTEEGYRQIVQYPFGFGLSYTDFAWELVEAPANGTAIASSTDSFTVKVKVTNTGELPGKDVVQLYLNAPYTAGGIEKAAVTLVDFAKTETLQPGQSQTLTLTFTAYDLASYDCYDANENGFAGYELEAGSYTLKLMTDSHTGTELTFALQVAQGLCITTDPTTGETVENLFTGDTAYGSPADGGVTYMSRADFAGTFPTARVAGSKTATAEPTYDGELETVLYGQDSGLYLVTRADGSKATLADLTGESGNTLIWNKELLLQLYDYDNALWDTFLNQITKEETQAIIKDGGFKINAVQSLGMLETEESDGPSGLSRVDAADRTAWPAESLTACSWNGELLYNMGRAVGMEAVAANIQGWYAPGVNLHRSAYSSRNFEYYSEDPVLSGKLGAQAISGAKQEGIMCYLKHFAVSEAGKNPSQVSTWLTEQTLRETYLKAFEIAVKEGDANAVMSAFNAIGDVYCGHNQALLQGILRGEWGFRGQVITDWWGEYMTINDCVLAGNDKMLLRRETTQEVDLSDDASQISNAARQSVKNILYSFVDSCVTGGFYGDRVNNQNVQDATDEGAAGEEE